MTARRNNKKRPLRQTTGEKFPSAVVNTGADPAAADTAAASPAANGGVAANPADGSEGGAAGMSAASLSPAAGSAAAGSAAPKALDDEPVDILSSFEEANVEKPDETPEHEERADGAETSDASADPVQPAAAAAAPAAAAAGSKKTDGSDATPLTAPATEQHQAGAESASEAATATEAERGAEPAPGAGPAAEPAPSLELAVESAPVVEPKAELVVEPVAEPGVEHAASSEPAPKSKRAIAPEPAADDAEAAATAEPAGEVAQAPAPTAASAAAPEPKPKPARTARRTARKPAPEPELVIAPATEHAEAEGAVLMSAAAQIAALKTCGTATDMIATARAAGILAGKRAGELVPSTPARTVSRCQVNVRPIATVGEPGLKGWEPARADGRVGFALQASVDGCSAAAAQTSALAAASTAGLALFDLLKDEDPAIELCDMRIAGAEPAPDTAPEAEAETASAPNAPASPLPGGAGTGTPAPAIAFIGYQNAGKTTLVERVISKLSGRGLRVGSIKLHGPKGFDIDQPGKDSWRHAQAGSRHVGLISPDQYAEYASTEQEVPVADLLTHFTDVDVVIVEGYKTTGIPSIVVARSGVDRIRGINSYNLVDANTLAVACNDVTARGFRAQWSKMAEEAGEQPGASMPVPLPSFLDINDVPEIVSFVVDKLELSKK